jgi:hypothetical protein
MARPAPIKEAAMRSESEIRLMMGHVHGLVQKYQAVKEQAAASGDQKAERAAWTKEVSYVSALEALAWAVGDIEASFDQGEAVLIQPLSIR